MIAILTALAPLFLITALGYALVQIKFGDADIWPALDHITFFVLFPALLAKTLMRADLASVPAQGFIFVSVASLTVMGAALLTAYLLMARPVTGPAFTSVFQGVVRFQSTVTVAISGALYGEPGLTFAAISVACLVPLAQVYTVLVLLLFGEGNHRISLRPILERLAINPLTLACLLGFLLNVTGVPDFVYDTFSILGSAAIGLTLLAVGAGLRLKGARGAMPAVAVSIAVRLILMPVLVFALSRIAGLSGLGRTIAIIAAAVPSAPTAYTMARKMGGDFELMAQIITFQSVASMATLPLCIYLAEAL